MQRNRLTDAKIRGAKSKAKLYKLSDGGGLFLHVFPNGSRLWRWRFWLDRKEQSFAIGSYPDIALVAARNAADIARESVRRGINPILARQDERHRNLAEGEARRRELDGSFDKVLAAYLERVKPEVTAGSHYTRKNRCERFLLPTLGALPISRIGAAEIRPILASSAKAGAWAPVRVKSDLNAIFSYAVQQGLCDSNPIPAMRGIVATPRSQGKAVLTLAQIRAFYAKLRAYSGHPETAPCLRFIALTACRPGEAANAEWTEIDAETDNLWRRPAEKMKARREHVSPLSRQALALLDDLRAISGTGRYLFPHRTTDGHLTTNRLAYAMRDLDLGPRATPHCWRATFSTWANERGFRPDAIERQLAHVESNAVRATYNRALLVEERRELMQAWADYLSSAEAENVIAFRPTTKEAG